MCGLAGMVVPSDTHTDPAEVTRFSVALQHRGPDDHGFLGWRSGEVARTGRSAQVTWNSQLALVHRRLAILDVSELGWQPMSTPDGRYHIIFNGEIYNYLELRKQLEGEGHHFVSHSDTEVLLAAIRAWGTSALSRLVGMFAFALLDTSENSLLLARDPLGIKPLFWSRHRGGVVFASEVKALLTLEDLPRTPDLSQVFDFLLAGESDQDTRSFLANVHQLEPGHFLRIQVGTQIDIAAPVPFWSLLVDEDKEISYLDAVDKIREHFLHNVKLHLRSDVPVGAALSGGIDSSAIVAAMRHLEPNLDLHTFSYLAEDERINEKRWIECVETAIGSRGHHVGLAGSQLSRTLDRVMMAQDEPFATTSIAAQYLVFESASFAGVRVMLDGQGADEMFAGYPTFYAPHASSLLRSGQLRTFATFWRALASVPDVKRSNVSRYIAHSFAPPALKQAFRGSALRRGIPEWMNSTWFADRGITGSHRKRDPGGALRPQLSSAVTSSLRPLLRYEDRNSMAHSVESRVPFLTPAFVQLALSLPGTFVIDRQATRKSILRDALRGLVPDAILDRKDKIGFQTPERSLMGSVAPWANRMLRGLSSASFPVISEPHLALLSDALATNNPVPAGLPMWRLLSLAGWVKANEIDFG
jgi:asparagine synthase (glutamine-hydrolysing)